MKELNVILKRRAGLGRSAGRFAGTPLERQSPPQAAALRHRSHHETDVLLASASNAIIIGFNVRPERKAQELADQEKVDIRLHSIIYELQDEIKRAMTAARTDHQRNLPGRAEVQETFRIPKSELSPVAASATAC